MTSIQKAVKVIAICLAIFIIIGIINGILLFIGVFTSFNSSSNIKNFVERYDNIDRIEIDVLSSDILLKEGLEFRVEAADTSDKTKITYTNGKLTIKENKQLFQTVNNSGEIIIYVPEGELLHEVEIETGASKLLIEDININNLDIDGGAGSLSMNNITTKNLDIDGGVGNINITSSDLNNADINAGVGNVKIEAYMTGDSNIDCGVGEINLLLLGNESDYRILIDKAMGNVNINGEAYNNKVYGDGINKIEIDEGVGNIKVNFEK